MFYRFLFVFTGSKVGVKA